MLFPWYTKYPYQNDEVLNLDWVLKTIDSLVKEVADFVTLNTIKYADPIQWNITTQYEKNTVVIEPISGSAYISVKPVPAGVAINNTDYWDIIFTLDVISANKNITLRDDANNLFATFESEIGDWLLWQGTLYCVTRQIEIGNAYVDNYNIERYTVERFVRLYIYNVTNYIDTLAGSLTDLTTTDKTNLVAAINETIAAARSAISAIGTLTDLTTVDKTNTVAAINETIAAARSAVSAIGNLTDLTTTDKTNLVSAINEVLSALTSASNYINNRINTQVEPKLSQREFLVCGDSYGDESGEWSSQVPDMLQIDSTKWHNVCVGGAGFISNGTLLFINQIQNYSGDKNIITDIIICGGLNDSTNSDIANNWWNVLRTNMTAFDAYAKANYPKAKISLGYIGNGIDFDPSSLISGRVYACRQLCKYFYNNIAADLGWNILHNVELALCPNYTNIGADGVHPSIFGSNALAKAITEAIVNGTAQIRYPLYEATNGNSMLKYSVVNDVTTLHIKDHYIAVNNGNTIQSASEWQTLNNLYFNDTFEANAVVRLDGFDNLAFQFVPARLQFNANKLRVELNSTDSSGNYKTGYVVTASTGYLRIINCDIDIPTEILA